MAAGMHNPGTETAADFMVSLALEPKAEEKDDDTL
jgi:hypothetical protein